MAAKKNTRNQTQSKSLPWGPMILSFLVGAFVMFLFHLKDNVPADTAQTAKKDETKTVKPKFEFYDVLPDMEVVVDQPADTPAHKPANKPATPDSDTFMIQVGSFKKMNDADAFKARLALLGIESKVQTVTIDNKDTWHRVQVGPIVGRDEADTLQKTLKENGFKALLLRTKNG